MADEPLAISRPQRWDVPFDPDMTNENVDRVLSIEPFSQIDPQRFPAALPLRKLILNDCRIVDAHPGDIIVREGDYGSSLFFIMAGTVRVAMDSMSTLGRNGVEFKSVTEDLDRSTPVGKFSTTMMMGMAEMFSDMLGTHVKKGVTERARQGLHLGGIPFGYDNCKES